MKAVFVLLSCLMASTLCAPKPKQRNSLKKRRKLPFPSESNLLNLSLLIQMKSKQRQKNFSKSLSSWKQTQKAQLRQKALKKGLDPDAFSGKYPPPIRMYSKYERRTDTRTYDDRKKLYEGGREVIRAESLDAIWKEKYEEW